MELRPFVREALARVERVSDGASFLAPLVTRITLGLGFYGTGTGKLANLDRTTAFFAGLGIPAPGLHAVAIGGLEMVGGVALLFGLLTRPFAALLSATMLVALATADREGFLASWGSAAEGTPTDIAAYVYLLLLGWLVFHGAGAASVDRVISRFLGRPSAVPHPAPANVG